MNAKTKYILSMIIFGTVSLFAKSIPASPLVIVMLRCLIGVIFIALMLKIAQVKIDFSAVRAVSVTLVLSGICLGLNWVLLFCSYQHTSVAVASLCYYFSPAIVLIASVFIYHEKLTISQLVYFLTAAFGLILILFGNQAEASASLIGIVYALGAAFCYALTTLLNMKLKELPGMTRSLFQCLSALILLFPFCLNQINFASFTLISWLSQLTLGIVHTGIALSLFFSSLSSLKGQQIALYSYLDPLVAILISLLVFHEPLSFGQVIGGALILGSALCNEYQQVKTSD